MNKLSRKIHSKKERKIKVIQFGEGNFLRAFADWMIQIANDQQLFEGSVLVVQPQPFGRISALEEQDGLYTVILEGLEQGVEVQNKKIIDVLQEFVNPYEEYDKYLNHASNDDLEIVISNTTEAGIILNTKDLDFSKVPTSFPGKLLAFLHRRFELGKKGLYIIPCELIEHNGKTLQKVLNELAILKGFTDDFCKWLNKENVFINTLVDRIVPGYPKNQIEEISKDIGYIDNSLVKGEIFHLWVLERNEELMEILPLHKLGLNVIFTKDITPYKEQKVKLLNGAHTALVPVGYLYGLDTVKECMDHDVIRDYIKKFMFEEVVPTINLEYQQVSAFAHNILDRFSNPYIKHNLMDISLNSMTKYKTRVLPSVLEFIEKTGKIPKRGLFSLAALMYFYRGLREGEKILLKDDQVFIEMWNGYWSKHELGVLCTKEMVINVLSLETHWGRDLSNIPHFTETVTEYLQAIIETGMSNSISML